MKKGMMIVGSAVISLSLTACGVNNDTAMNNNNQGQGIQTEQVRTRNVNYNNNNNNQGRGIQTEQVRTRNVNYINNNNNNNNNMNQGTLSVSDRAELQVEKMEEVEEANVIIWNNNAYVAVRLANDNGTRTNNGNRTGTINSKLNNKANSTNGQNYTGTNVGVDRSGANRNTYMNGNTTNNVGGGTNEQSGATDNHLTTDYASDWNNYSPVSNSFEQKIADQVRLAEKRIHEVYVSNNPHLYSRMTNYAEDIRNNGNRNGLFEDFNTTIGDYFGRNR